jgi:hypothetical protein
MENIQMPKNIFFSAPMLVLKGNILRVERVPRKN